VTIWEIRTISVLVAESATMALELSLLTGLTLSQKREVGVNIIKYVNNVGNVYRNTFVLQKQYNDNNSQQFYKRRFYFSYLLPYTYYFIK